jgi:hypothetical protein
MSRNEYLYSGILAIMTAVGFWIYQYRSPQPNKIPIPPFVIDPKVWQRTGEGFQNSIVPAPLYRDSIVDSVPVKKSSAPYELPAFGDDMQRNQDDIDFDTYLNLPLVGDGVTYKNRDRLKDLDAPDDTEPRLEEFSYFRLVVTETRAPRSATSSIGGIKFMKGLIHVSHPLAKVWDPHTGEETAFKEMDPWSNSTRQFIVKFPCAMQIDSYKIRTGKTMDTVNSDPVKWRLEGSRNGTYWVVLDDRTDGKAFIPSIRNIWTTWKFGEESRQF